MVYFGMVSYGLVWVGWFGPRLHSFGVCWLAMVCFGVTFYGLI